MRRDLNGHVQELQPTLLTYAGGPMPIGRLIEQEVVQSGGPAAIKRRSASLTHGVLLLTRTAVFIGQLCQRLATPGAVPSAAARAAYSSVLAPFHSWAVAGIVRLAFAAVPARRELMAAFGFAPSAAGFSGGGAAGAGGGAAAVDSQALEAACCAQLLATAEPMLQVAQQLTQWLAARDLVW